MQELNAMRRRQQREEMQNVSQLEPAQCKDGERYNELEQKCMPICEGGTDEDGVCVPVLEVGASKAILSGWDYATCDGEYVYKGEFTAPTKRSYTTAFMPYSRKKFRLWDKGGEVPRYVVSYGETEEERSRNIVCHKKMGYTGSLVDIPQKDPHFGVPTNDTYASRTEKPLLKIVT